MEKAKIVRMLSSWISKEAVEKSENKSFFKASNEAGEYYNKIEVIEKELNTQKKN